MNIRVSKVRSTLFLHVTQEKSFLSFPRLNVALARTDDASFVDGAGGDQVDGGLHPKHVPVVLHVTKFGSHVVDSYKAVDAKA